MQDVIAPHPQDALAIATHTQTFVNQVIIAKIHNIIMMEVAIVQAVHNAHPTIALHILHPMDMVFAVIQARLC